jgi:hypothetical protein
MTNAYQARQYEAALHEFYTSTTREQRDALGPALYECFQCHRLPDFNCTSNQARTACMVGSVAIMLFIAAGQINSAAPSGVATGLYIAGGVGLLLTMIFIFKNCAYKNSETARLLSLAAGERT